MEGLMKCDSGRERWALGWICIGVIVTCCVAATGQEVEHINPPGLHHSPRFTQVIRLPLERLIYVSGQAGEDSSGKLAIGFEAQVKQAFANLGIALEAAGAKPSDVIQINTFITDLRKNIGIYRTARETFFGASGNPPTSTTVEVTTLPAEGSLIEVNAVAHIAGRAASDGPGRVYVTSELRSKPAKSDDLREHLIDRARKSRLENGCIRYELLNDKSNPDTFLLNEEWTDQASLDSHLHSAGHLAWIPLRDQLVAERKVTIWKEVNIE